MKIFIMLIFTIVLFSACLFDNETELSTFPFEFVAEDLYGNTVTHASLGERDFFLLYFWATWCGSCIDSMPDLAALAHEFGERVGFVSLLEDFQFGKESAIQITEDLNIPFFTMDIYNSDFETFTHFVDSGFVPTAAIIDTDGNMVGDMIIGTSRIRAAIEALGD